MVALIGGGERPKFSQNTLVVYDAATSEPVMDITFGSPLRKVVTDQIHHKNEGAMVATHALITDPYVHHSLETL